MVLVPQWIIEKKRDGRTLSEDEIRFFVSRFTEGTIPEYQMAALAMAIFFRGMAKDELAVLTDAMMRSGDVLDLSSVKMPTADKHSTGGIGDKISLPLAPLVASCGVAVPMISGRGLGITGGTLDKLESIPGYRTNLSVGEFVEVLNACGCSIIGQTDRLAPADRKLYALRDVTGTVPSIPLICASIMSKKGAEGAETIVFDVKCGRGAFMKTRENARQLASVMIETGRAMGRKMGAIITDMDRPLGRTVGNSLEILETIQCLKGEGPSDVMEITMALGIQMLLLSGVSQNKREAESLLCNKLESGVAAEVFRDMVRLHGGNPAIVDNPSMLPQAKIQQDLASESSGFVHDVDADGVGRACLLLGAGRKAVTDKIDHAVGLSDLVQTGERVKKGDVLARIHALGEEPVEQARKLILESITIGAEPVERSPVILEVL